jgi:methanogenic corrinoid protein MtbC1
MLECEVPGKGVDRFSTYRQGRALAKKGGPMAVVRQQAALRDCWEGSEVARTEGGAARARTPDGEGSEQRFERLVRTIDAEIIPRLVLARRAAPLAQVADDGTVAVAPVVPTIEEVHAFARLVIANDVGAASAEVARMRARGVSLESIFLDLLSPAARRLGEMWLDDTCDFTEVTIGLWRLHQVVRELSPAFGNEVDYEGHGRRALLVAVPGEQHTFGLCMVAEFFRRSGWDVSSGPIATTDELLALLRSDWFAVVGLSVSCETRLEGLAATIHAMRRASRNGSIGIMVGGQIFVEHPELVALVGADATAVDGRQATLQAESLVALLATAN